MNGEQTEQAPLPIPGQRNVLITSALPYVNNYPHLGNIIGAVLSADVYARYLRQRQTNAIYICGTDEYGTATETKAQQEKLTPREICDKYHALHRDVYKWFDISFDAFGRTSTPSQTKIVQEIFWDVYNNGFIVEDTIIQLYCDTVCKRFLADRYVNGTCPSCGYQDARGDQCDNCGRLLNPSELITPRCSTCGNSPIPKKTTHLFLDLPKLQTELSDWIKSSSEKGKWTTNALAMTETWLRSGLKSRCITRDLKWGVPVPLEGFRDKVFYVWFDAPVGYPSITAGRCGEGWRDWWLPEDGTDIDLVQFMGKDNVPFHTIVFPGSLLATRRPWTKLHHISTTEYLNYETGKFSKSRGIGVFGNDAIASGIPPEVWRYYLLVNRPEGSDTVFTWDDLAAKNNDELIKTLGNYINRTVHSIFKMFSATVPEYIPGDPENIQFTADINTKLTEYIALLDKVSLKAGVKKAMEIASLGNLYLQRKEPWHLIKRGEKELAGSCLAYAANLAVLVTIVFEPYLGSQFSRKVFRQLGIDYQSGVNNLIPDSFDCQYWLRAGMSTSKPEILFTALTPAQIESFRSKHGGRQNAPDGDGANGATPAAGATNSNGSKPFTLDLRVGKIVELHEHEESDRLFVGKVDVAEDTGPRTVVAGLRDAYSREDLLGSKVVLVCNLAPATLAGIESQGMILCAEKKKDIRTLGVDDKIDVGQKVVPNGLPVAIPDAPLDRKGFQTASKPLRVGKEGKIVFDKKFDLVSETDPSLLISSQGVADGGKVK